MNIGSPLCHLEDHPILGKGGFICFPDDWALTTIAKMTSNGVRIENEKKWFGV